MDTSNEGLTARGAGDQGNRPGISRPWLLLGAGLVIGFVAEALLHGQPPGLGYAIAALFAAAVWLGISAGLGVRPSATGLVLLGLGVFFSAMVAVRASPALTALNILLGMGLALLLAAVYTGGGLSRLGLADYVVELCVSGLGLLIQPFILIFGDLPKARPTPGAGRRTVPVLVGLLLALPLLLVFGALFASADAVFASYLHHLFDWLPDLSELIARLILSLMLTWLALGLARHAFTTAERRPWERMVNLDSLRVGGATAITVLVLVDVLFLAFVAVQAVYLFGGADTLARSGLSYSEYARRGFFELVAVAALVLSLVFFLDWLVRSAGTGARRAVNALHGLLVLLTMVILASALYRMWLYQQEYGLTELRFYTTAFMVWLAVVLIWLATTVLRHQPSAGEHPARQRFAFGALVAGLALAVLLNLANPDAIIARTNLGRAEAGIGRALDTSYLGANLSADAVPTLLAGLERLPDRDTAGSLACYLWTKQGQLDRQAGSLSWRGMNWSIENGRRLLAAADANLAAACPRKK